MKDMEDPRARPQAQAAPATLAVRRVSAALTGAVVATGLLTSVAPASAADPTPRLLGGQQAAFDQVLAQNVSDGLINQRRQDALDMIRHVLETLACSPAPQGEAPGDLARLKVPGGILNGIPPMALMPGHPKTQCLELTAIDGWSLAGPDHLNLRAAFQSAVSGERGTRRLSLERGRDGLWRIRQLL